jgi:hypothetical protein
MLSLEDLQAAVRASFREFQRGTDCSQYFSGDGKIRLCVPTVAITSDYSLSEFVPPTRKSVDDSNHPPSDHIEDWRSAHSRGDLLRTEEERVPPVWMVHTSQNYPSGRRLLIGTNPRITESLEFVTFRVIR